MVHEGSVNVGVFAEFPDRLVEGMERKLILVVDGHSIHRAKVVQAKLEEFHGRLELVYLPLRTRLKFNPAEGSGCG